ncbi:mucolipin-3-like [Oppia nitens]|uniref:mucolipin-3-like n=1 Tax=Oppia nitens TaxID=1686743 RepID=UPI0023D9EC11|nr:mucolipin-3-like [Oppia nitens]
MSVVENVHAVVSSRNRSHNDQHNRLMANESDDDDDIDVIEKCLSTNSTAINGDNEHFMSSSSVNLQGMNSMPPTESRVTATDRDRLRRRLKYYFMSPIDKWRAKGRFPYKLCLQIIKIVFVTIQLIVFGIDMSDYMTLEANVVTSLRKLFLPNYDTLREVMTYPPAAGPYALYEKQELFDSIDYAIHRFANISHLSVGSFGYQTPNATLQPMSVLNVCFKTYTKASLEPSNYYYYIDNKIQQNCIEINNTYEPGDERWNQLRFKDYMTEHKFDFTFDSLVSLTIQLPLRTIYLNSLSRYDAPECYDLNVNILFDNCQHSGQMLISLTSTNLRHECDGNLKDNEEQTHIERQVLNIGVILLCLMSFFLCLRSLIRGQKLRSKTVYFFRKQFGKGLSFEDISQFIDGWIIMIILNDILIITGSFEKINMETNSLHGSHYNYCSLLLGVGNLLVWCGLLRYLGFFHKYNILIITLKHAFPHVLRFLLCALILYSGFCFCGWVVLGPYHFKFRTISTTSECLFALMNGDDLFATFAITNTNSTMIWWFSRLYLYSFIILFIYVVLSLFIAIIMDSYETIKDYYQNGFPMTDMQKFIAECEDSMASYLEDQRHSPTFRQSCAQYCNNLRSLISSIFNGRRQQ